MSDFFDDLIRGLSEVIEFEEGSGKAVVHYRSADLTDEENRNFYNHLTDEEKNIIDGKTPVTSEQADRLIEKIKDYRTWLDYCALDDAVAELANGMYVIPSDGKGGNFNIKAVMKKREELGRPLTDEEFEEFIIHDDEN